ncbi:MAG: signal peptidase II [Clostridiales bacterium]|nr:signal peptidase II [Clostridiales bacterium]
MWYALLLAACIAGDQLLKYWVVRHLEIGQSAAFLPGLVRLTRLHNTGAAWGSFSGSTALLTAVTAVLLVAVAWLVLKKVIRHPLGLCAAMLVLGGGIGNMIDRICRGYVVDMFDLEFMSYPIFNLADCFVVVGVILGAVYYLWFYDKYDGRKAKHDDGADSVQ